MTNSTNNVAEYLTTKELLTAYNVANKYQLAIIHGLTIVRKSKRINGKVGKVYTVAKNDAGISASQGDQPTGFYSQNPENANINQDNNHVTNLQQFGSKLATALAMLYDGVLIRVNLAAFGHVYDVVIGDFDLVVGYNHVYTTEELKPVMGFHITHEINHGCNGTGDKIRFNSSGRLVSDYGAAQFHIAHVTTDTADAFIYRLLIELATEMDKEIDLTRIGFKNNEPLNNSDYGSPKTKELPDMWESVEYEYAEYLYPACVIGSGLVVSNLLFNGELRKEQSAIAADRGLDGFITAFGGQGKHTEQVEAEAQAISDAVYKLYRTKTAKALAKLIAKNPTKLALVQMEIEKSGNQQWRNVNKLLKALGLTASVGIDGSVQIGIYGDYKIKDMGGFKARARDIDWLEPQPQTNQLQLDFNEG